MIEHELTRISRARPTSRPIEGIDPTWDAGVIKKSWAIGDYTWIDNNGDGIQDEGDDILPGVTVEADQGWRRRRDNNLR